MAYLGLNRKTTLLSCIVGLKKLDSGEISVLGGRPEPGSLLGYMPQASEINYLIL